MRHQFIDHHRAGNSLIHHADPRLKFLMMVIYIFVVVLVPYQFNRYLFYLAVIPVTFALISRVSLFHYVSKLAKVYPFVFLISIFIPFLPTQNSSVFHIGFLNIYETGLHKFLLINGKAALAMLMSIILTTTTEFHFLLQGMEKLRVPTIIILILSFMYRFIFLLIDEAERMSMARKSRYIHLPLMKRLRAMGQQIGMLFIRTFERGERVYQAMEARGFRGEIHTLNELRWQRRDTVFFTLFSFTLVIPFLLI